MHRLLLPRPSTLGAFLTAAVSFWFWYGTLAVTDYADTTARVGLLPAVWLLVVLVSAAAALACLLGRQSRRWWPLFAAGLIVVPWIPGSVPRAFLVWSGPLGVLVWAGVLAGAAFNSPLATMTRYVPRWAGDPARAPAAAVLAAVVVFGVASWQTSARYPGGDEPHYLIVTESLLYDGDLQIENNHRERHYTAYFRGELKPDFLRRGTNGQIYSIHAPGLPALLLPAFALFGYAGAKAFVMLVVALGTGLAWRAAFAVSGDLLAAWFGWGAVVLSAPVMFHAFALYPDPVAAVVVMTGVWALLAAPAPSAGRWFLHGVALSLPPWLHTRFAVLSVILVACGLVRILRGDSPWRRATMLLAGPVASTVAWLGFFYRIYGTINPAAPYGGHVQTAVRYVPAGLGGLLFDQQFGIVLNAPVYIFVGVGLLVMVREAHGNRTGHRPLGFALLLITCPYLLVASSYPMWWGGWSAPGRFAVPVLLTAAIPLAVFWARARTWATRSAALTALAVSTFITAAMTFVGGGRLIFNSRDGHSLWLGWANAMVDLGAGLPSFHRDPWRRSAFLVAVWAAVLTGAWLLLRWLGRLSRGDRALMSLAVPTSWALAFMLGLTLVWARPGVTVLKPVEAQLGLCSSFDPGSGRFGLTYAPLRVSSRQETVTALRIGSAPIPGRRTDRPQMFLPRLPAGTYRLLGPTEKPSGGELRLLVGDSTFPVARFKADEVITAQAPLVRLPVAVRSLTVDGDQPTRELVARLVLQPVFLPGNAAPFGNYRAQRAMPCGTGVAYFPDDSAYWEPGGLWVRPGSEATIILQSPGREPTLRVLVRNAPTSNHITMRSGDWARVLDMASREETVVDVPADPDRSAAVVRVSAERGFRPSDVEPGNRDTRLLGCWLELR